MRVDPSRGLKRVERCTVCTSTNKLCVNARSQLSVRLVGEEEKGSSWARQTEVASKQRHGNLAPAGSALYLLAARDGMTCHSYSCYGRVRPVIKREKKGKQIKIKTVT